MNINGWAFNANGDEIRNKRYNRYKELKAEDFEIESVRSGYAQKEYEILVKNNELNHLDVLLWCDSGNTCFGGCVDARGTTKEGFKKYRATVYTD